MARPQFAEPVIPSQESPSSTSTSKCGDSWNSQFEVRAPYKSTDKYSEVLPTSYDKFEVSSSNLEESFPIVSSSGFKAALKKAINGAWEILDEYDSDGYIDDTNKASIKKMIQRAEDYSDKAKELWDWWDDQYRPDSEQPVYGWPLDEDMMEECSGLAPATATVSVTLPAVGATDIEFTCPTAEHKAQHDQDRGVYHRLLMAALRNARCAQEAAAAVGIFNRNKEFNENLATGPKLGLAPTKPPPGKSITPAVPGEPPAEPEEPDDAPVVEVEPETKPSKKKKDNTLLLVGGAALGLLFLKGK